MDTTYSIFMKIPGVSNAEARNNVAKKLSKLDKVAIMIDEDKPATKKDVAKLRSLTKKETAKTTAAIRADIAEVKVYIAESKADTDAKITKFREENKTALANLKTDLTWRLVLLIGVVAGVTSTIIKIM